MKKGAIFDMDGLLFDTEAIWQKNWTRVANDMNLTLPDQFRKDICGTSGAIMKKVIETYYGVEDGSGIMQNVIEGVHKDLRESVPEKPGLHEILDFFKSRGVKMAVASSSSLAQIESNCRNAGITGYFDALVSGSDLGKSKPAPDIFLKAAEMIGLDAKDCYVFEDAFNGVQAGYNAGSAVIMIPDMTPPTDEIKALTYGVYGSLLEAMEALE